MTCRLRLILLLSLVAASAASESYVLSSDADAKEYADVALASITELMLSGSSCNNIFNFGWSDPELGHFTNALDSPYCSPNCTRNLVCCAPERPEQLQVHLVLFRGPGDAVEVKSGQQGIRDEVQATGKPVVFIIHGFLNDPKLDPIFNLTAAAFLDRGYLPVVVDWSKGAREYFQAVANLRVVGALVGQLVLYWDVPDRTLCSGFSLGGQTCGEVGRFVKARGRVLNRCHTIDPAGPLFDGCDNRVSLSRDDCETVVVIHGSDFHDLSTMLLTQGYGTALKVGHCDFWFQDNTAVSCSTTDILSSATSTLLAGGTINAGDVFTNMIACKHVRPLIYYLYQVRGECFYVGMNNATLECRSITCLQDAVAGKGAPLAMPLFPDDSCNPSYNVNYATQVGDQAPYCSSEGK